MSTLSVHDYPSFASFVRDRRMSSTAYSVQKASLAAGFPPTTWSSIEGGRYPRPSRDKLHAVARVLDVRPWPLALIAGTKPKLQRLGGLITDRLPQAEWWNLRGGAFVRLAREKAGLSLEVATQRWRERWPAIPALGSVSAWDILESKGLVPKLPAPPVAFMPDPPNDIAKLSGAWLWSILDAATGDPQTAFYLLPGLSVVVGEADHGVAVKSDESAAWDRLAQAYRECHTTRPESFDDAKYFETALVVAREMGTSAGLETASQKLARITAVWNQLNAEEQDHVVGIVEGLGHRG